MNEIKIKSPELLAPAGDLDKLKLVFLYGADAVYIGAKQFGLRSAAGNFSIEEIEEGIEYSHKRNKKVYLVVNTLPHNHEVEGLVNFLKTIKNINLDALIISDPGVLTLSQEITAFDIHLSTQASCVNYESAKFWLGCGVKRIILGREVSLEEAYYIQNKTGIEIEIFIHGSMCMSYSGKCTVSNYLSLRDANRGGCTNSCRWEYSLIKHNDIINKKIYPFNSKDLWAIEVIPEIVRSNKIASLKIEGRMKNYLYLANTISVYREAIDFCTENINHSDFESKYSNLLSKFKKELHSNVNRGFTKGFLKERAGAESILYDEKVSKDLSQNIGSIIEKISDKEFIVDIKNTTRINEEIEIIIPFGANLKRTILCIRNMANENIDGIPNNRFACITIDKSIKDNIETLTIIRKSIKDFIGNNV